MQSTCRFYRNGELEEENFEPNRISEMLKERDALVWLDLLDPRAEELDWLAKEFGFHELAIEDAAKGHQRPKVDQYESYYFLVAYAVTAGEERFEPNEISIFVSHDYLVTVRKDKRFDLRPVLRRWDARSQMAKEGGGYLLYILLDEIVDRYFDVVDEYEDRIDALQEEIFGGDSASAPQNEIFRLKTDLVRMRHGLSPLRDVLDVLQQGTAGNDVVTRALEPYYRDVYDHVLRASDFIDSAREILSSALEAHLAVVSNRLNDIMKRLTSWAAIILVPTLIAGVYGMNFRHMPELDWLFGYPFALGLMVLSGILLWRSFKHRDWI